VNRCDGATGPVINPDRKLGNFADGPLQVAPLGFGQSTEAQLVRIDARNGASQPLQ
jgi:hypothetical protein